MSKLLIMFSFSLFATMMYVKRFPTGSGIALGIAIGIALGVGMHNIGVGIAIGIAVGVAIDVARKRK